MRYRPADGPRARFLALLLAPILLVGIGPVPVSAATVRADVIVYGGTPGGIVAAVTAARAGADVLVLETTSHIGGMVSSGLTWTDIGDKRTLGGYAREFFDRTQAIEGTLDGRYHFQPKTAEAAFKQMLHSAHVPVRYRVRFDDAEDVRVTGTRITSIRATDGNRYIAPVFIDATYEGDLLAAAGVDFALGREATSAYGEALAGVRPTQIVLADTDGVTLPFTTKAPGPLGSADRRVQASNFRVCFSADPANQTPFRKPDGYDVGEYDVYVDYIAAREAALGMPAELSWLVTLAPVANQKFDVNDRGVLSTAIPGRNWSYSLANERDRRAATVAHRRISEGLLYFLANDSRVSPAIREEMAGYGLCKDEFTDNGNWPWLLYIREGRRMLGEYVLTQADITTDRSKSDLIGVASYRVDSHLVSRWVDGAGRLLVEGSMSLPYQNYAIPYRAITPRRSESTNLLVPVAASASHVAHSSLRMEPQYMIMGEAAGEAAAMAVGGRDWNPRTGSTDVAVDVQAVRVSILQDRLRARGVYLVNP